MTISSLPTQATILEAHRPRLRKISPAPRASRSVLFGTLIASILVLAGVLIEPAAAQHRHEDDESALGHVQMNVSCDAAVTHDFDRAVALLHHMQYDEARAAFEQIATADPECGMARWGIAMTMFQPLWPSRPTVEQLQRGSDLLAEARELGVEAGTEENLVAAAEAFYREPESTDYWTRIRRWSDAMSEAYADSPEDPETAAFYALSQLAVGQVASDRLEHNARAANVLRDIYERERLHPGAVHYTIHANDVDARAGESREIVQSYGDIAPEVPHALHMPTHIYVRTGEWPQVIDWNRRSADAALEHPAGDAVSHHYLHALDYLVYAYLQRGENARAQSVIDEVNEHAGPFQGTFISAFHLASMPARYAVERRKWDEALQIEPRTPASVQWDQFWWPESISWFASGLGAVHSDDISEAKRAEQRMIELRDAAADAGEQVFADYIEVDRLILSARIAHAAGESDRALDLAREAVELEKTTEKHPVTPGALYPSQEALGDLQRELDRPREALASFEASLEMWPERFNTLVGAARAAEEAGLPDEAAAHYRNLLNVAAGVDADRPELEEARRYLDEAG